MLKHNKIVANILSYSGESLLCLSDGVCGIVQGNQVSFFSTTSGEFSGSTPQLSDDGISAITISNEANVMVVGTDRYSGSKLIVYSVPNFNRIRVIAVEQNMVPQSISITSDGNFMYVIVSGLSKTLMMVDLQTGSTIASVSIDGVYDKCLCHPALRDHVLITGNNACMVVFVVRTTIATKLCLKRVELHHEALATDFDDDDDDDSSPLDGDIAQSMKPESACDDVKPVSFIWLVDGCSFMSLCGREACVYQCSKNDLATSYRGSITFKVNGLPKGDAIFDAKFVGSSSKIILVWTCGTISWHNTNTAATLENALQCQINSSIFSLKATPSNLIIRSSTSAHICPTTDFLANIAVNACTSYLDQYIVIGYTDGRISHVPIHESTTLDSRIRLTNVANPWFGNTTASAFINSITVNSSNKSYSGYDYWLIGTGNGLLALVNHAISFTNSDEAHPSYVTDTICTFQNQVAITVIHVLTSSSVFLVGFLDGSMALCCLASPSSSSSSSVCIQVLSVCKALGGAISSISSNLGTNILSQTAILMSYSSKQALVINLTNFPRVNAVCSLNIDLPDDDDDAVGCIMSHDGLHAYIVSSRGQVMHYDLTDRKLMNMIKPSGSMEAVVKNKHQMNIDGSVIHVISVAGRDEFLVLTSAGEYISLFSLNSCPNPLAILRPDSLSSSAIVSMSVTLIGCLKGGIQFDKLTHDEDTRLVVSGTSSDGGMHIWEVAMHSDGSVDYGCKVESMKTRPTDETILCSSLSSDGRSLALFSIYGTCVLCKTSFESSFASSFLELKSLGGGKATLSTSTSMVASVALNSSSQILEAISHLSDGELSKGNFLVLPAVNLIQESATRRMLQEEALYSSTRERLIAKAKDIKTSLMTLLDRNCNVDPIDRLERREFGLDEISLSRQASDGDARCAKLVSDVDDAIKRNDLIGCRIKDSCVDSMLVKSVIVTDIDESTNINLDLVSYALPKSSEKSLLLLKQVKNLRRIEMKSIKRFVAKQDVNDEAACWPMLLSKIPKCKWIINDGDLVPNHHEVVSRLEREMIDDESFNYQASSASSSSKRSSVPALKTSANETGVVLHGLESKESHDDDDDVEGLLYPVVALRSQIQKRFQLLFLNQISIGIRSAFNEYFHSIQTLKADSISRIDLKRNRITEIAQEIQIPAPVLIKGQMTQDREDTDFVVKIFAGEVTSEPFEPQAARLERLRKSEMQKLALEELRRNDDNSRALNDMMYGILESKKASLLAGMDLVSATTATTSSDKNDEGSAKAANDDDAKLKKILEQEIKKLGCEICDIVSTFKEKLKFANNLKTKVDLELKSQELFMIRICLSLAEQEALSRDEIELQARLASSSELLSEACLITNSHQMLVDEQVSKLNRLTDEDKFLEKNFKREIISTCPDMDAGSFKVFIKLYKSRYIHDDDDDASKVDNGSEEEEEDGFQTRPSSAAAFFAGSESKRPDYAPRLREYKLSDIPESVAATMEEKTWSTFQFQVSLRTRKEDELMQVNRQIRKLNLNLEIFKTSEQVSKDLVLAIEARLSQVKKTMVDNLFNLDMLARLRQGQDEMLCDNGNSGYGSSSLLPTLVLDGVNGQIKSLNSAKISVMESIKTFRKRLNISLWDKTRLDKMIFHNVELMRDYQLLRVTRNLQDILKGKFDDKTSKIKETRSIERYRLKSDKYDEKLKELEEVCKKLEIRLDDVKVENGTLSEKLKSITEEVSFSDRAYRIRQASIAHKAGLSLRDDDSTLDPIVLSQARMKRIAMRRRLKTVVHVQEEEILMLRGELERLRRQTFPSFLDATRERLKFKFPDEK